ncbi:MAG TPA: hypothetical protein VFS20_25955 [Longimicrobium sp.]|nr:hypothetical protein [Longimicrobium sp.]
MIRFSTITIAASLALSAALPAAARAQAHDHGQTQVAHAGHAANTPMPAHDAAALAEQVAAVRAATARYRDHANAVQDGYRLFGQEGPVMGEHWFRRDLVPLPLDLARPSTLQYATIDGKKVLVGVAYTVYRRPGDPVPDGFAGSGDAWHTHDIVHLATAATADRPLARSIVERRVRQGKVGPDGRNLLTMVHAWVWLDNPDGLFAEEHRALPYLRAGLPAAWAAGAPEGAAEGIALLAPNACAGAMKRIERLARTDGRQEQLLAAACEQQAAQLRAAVDRHRDAAGANAAAARAWSGYQAAAARILTAEQRGRMQRILAAATEHPMVGM